MSGPARSAQRNARTRQERSPATFIRCGAFLSASGRFSSQASRLGGDGRYRRNLCARLRACACLHARAAHGAPGQSPQEHPARGLATHAAKAKNAKDATLRFVQPCGMPGLFLRPRQQALRLVRREGRVSGLCGPQPSRGPCSMPAARKACGACDAGSSAPRTGYRRLWK
jgi:hypothetical protein